MLRFVFTKTARYPGLEVEHNQFRRSLRTLLVNIKYRGFRRTLLGLLAIACAKAHLPLLQDHRFARQNMRESGLDTDGIVELDVLDIPEKMKSSAQRYEATSEYEFRHILERLNIEYSSYHFLDYGSGKGAILAAAAKYPFKSVTGVELSEQLHQTALQNIEDMKRDVRTQCGSIASVQGDAACYTLPPVPHVIYIFNAFGPDILQSVLDHIASDLADVHEPIYFLYNNPMHHELLEMSPEFDKLSNAFGGKWMVFARPGRS
ncbi:class I SAM-dependent methyltransferase [uncultured Sneathiella sp.]|uniref:class I SAM-dependent methyltransferase n=1 Tax=uncultured Sneathiella sp. TaxID=879315 RepID=UPI0025946DAB|nr:class I SAM-dependent methyltransferase [uncultured Sneathiella sp.]